MGARERARENESSSSSSARSARMATARRGFAPVAVVPARHGGRAAPALWARRASRGVPAPLRLSRRPRPPFFSCRGKGQRHTRRWAGVANVPAGDGTVAPLWGSVWREFSGSSRAQAVFDRNSLRTDCDQKQTLDGLPFPESTRFRRLSTFIHETSNILLLQACLP